MRKVLGTSLLLLTALAASLISLPSPFWFLPLALISVSIVGLNLGNKSTLDIGVLLSLISYLFVNRGEPLTVSNSLLIILFFFLFIGTWLYARNTLLVDTMESLSEMDKAPDDHLASFRRSSLKDISQNLVIGGFLTILGTFIGMYSSVGTGLGSNLEIILMVIFSASIFFIIYLKLNILSSG
ncbi:MAG: hypothetical protein ACOCTR_02540 [Candidatus Natronoplasma sp.]